MPQGEMNRALEDRLSSGSTFANSASPILAQSPAVATGHAGCPSLT
jgi:hypothetical protein